MSNPCNGIGSSIYQSYLNEKSSGMLLMYMFPFLIRVVESVFNLKVIHQMTEGFIIDYFGFQVTIAYLLIYMLVVTSTLV